MPAGTFSWSPNRKNPNLTRETIDALLERGIETIPYTVNDFTEIQGLQTKNAAGIITDFPDLQSYKQRPLYLAYKSGSGRHAFSRILLDGFGNRDLVKKDGWSEGWTSFMPFTVGANPHYLAYKAGTGDFVFARIHGDGAGRTDLVNSRTDPEGPWTAGWTSFMPT